MSEPRGEIQPPVRLCCGTRHTGPFCPDGPITLTYLDGRKWANKRIRYEEALF